MSRFRNSAFMFILSIIAFKSIAGQNATLDMSAEIIQGTCDISFPEGGTIQMGSIDPSPLIGTNQNTTAIHKFAIRAACTGLLNATGTPGIRVSGKTIQSSAGKIFRDDSSSSTGFGIVVAPDKNSGISWGDLKGNGDILGFTGFNPGGTGKVNNDIKMSAAVACGSASECTSQKLKAGSINASIVFSFNYH
ncbi:type 1 fimbrial protein [Escherichia coli]|uniref:fimbrial protein n=2 Tax=Escherichia TaxID=561 RepID=UPI000BE4F122|nr:MULTISPECIES: fimbrial protein [Escherichia]EEZ9682057.1 fimbrial protein [Escherichia coli O55]EFJ8615022.1 fimbrial protein [Escherichia coli]EFJ8659355.1 fimbrial protein [Escherichia coli]EFJ8662285.1 fimbrial protein [Escherichia coli]EFJ8668555.1 fimbrial protein [Escherichia coli]